MKIFLIKDGSLLHRYIDGLAGLFNLLMPTLSGILRNNIRENQLSQLSGLKPRYS